MIRQGKVPSVIQLEGISLLIDSERVSSGISLRRVSLWIPPEDVASESSP